MIIFGLLIAWCFIGTICFLIAEKNDLNDKQFGFILAIAGPVIWAVSLIFLVIYLFKKGIYIILNKLQ